VTLDQASVRAAVQRNAFAAGMPAAQIVVADSRFGGFDVRVVDSALAEYDDVRRRSLLLQGIENEVVTAELLTPDEEEWYGPRFIEDPYLPLWAEALARDEPDEELLFVSDLDADLDPPAVVTFYSLRGGVGRTTALVNAARMMASRGRRVVCIDMDLEAPGLSTLLGLPEPAADQGTAALLLALEGGGDIDVRDHIQRVDDEFELYCLPAGRVDAEYARRLRLIDPEMWYREPGNPLHRMLDLVSTSPLRPDLLLLDARTGVSPGNAPLLFDVSDLAVVCFFPHLQARRGTGALVRALLSSRTRRSGSGQAIAPEPRFLVSPLPPGPSAARVEARAAEWVNEWLAPGLSRRPAGLGALMADEIMHSVSYSADVAFRDRVSVDAKDWGPYQVVADWLEQILPPAVADRVEIVSPAGKAEMLDELRFSTGAAELQETLLDDYVVTRLSGQALAQDVPLIIGRKGTGKTAVFRRLLEASQPRPVPVCCPQRFLGKYPWVLDANGFAAIERDFGRLSSSWRIFWPAYIALAIYLGLEGGERAEPPASFELGGLSLAEPYDELAVVNALRSMLRHQDAGLLALRWLQNHNAQQDRARMLLFDGLDTGFGGAEGRDRRTRAVEGLLQFMTDNEARLDRLAFKIMLRADIWQQLRFDNRSHLFGRSVQLIWRDQAEYFKTVLKQAVRSSSFGRKVAELGLDGPVDEWGDSDVFRVWNLLVGERMKGGRTTFTRNWVWNRLADGQGDHGPRALSQLFNEAVRWERSEEGRNPYGRSVIRPRALVPSLDVASEEALQALVEEFPELQDTINALRRLGRTPLGARDLNAEGVAVTDLELAREIGLLAIHEGSAEDVLRYRVPDLYRRALGMTRKGQA
jgi:MinD-like ATPase involved in chromosome partitioning or flagellar assembly